MDVSRPHSAVSPSLEGEVLVTLAGTTRPLTGREVSRLVRRGSQAGVNRALQRLGRQGIVLTQPAGRATLYWLNRDHVAAAVVLAMAELRTQWVSRLRGAIDAWRVRPQHASLFGSAARGDGGVESDIDLFVVRPKRCAEENPSWRSQLDALAADVRRWTGNRLGISEVSTEDVARLRRKQPAIAQALRRDAITLAGPPVARMLARPT